ncbi:hypothetical protein J437_LFUL016621 [Ladona fulva]|uniref:Uncharacterized protein n=1 Tax=Ladona fulva TaxID=123851 RepID=A0A8K0P8S6_LADFU|nr:hypothetical protein J437_LFUL016621 [Ladona fulva]
MHSDRGMQLAKCLKVLQAATDLAGPRNAWTQDGKIILLCPERKRVHATSMKEVNAARDAWNPNK